jgi:hypothetical protein
MSRIVTIASRPGGRAAGLLATPWAAAIGIIFLLRWIFDVVLGPDAPVDAAVLRLGGRRARVDRVARAAGYQTPAVHSVPLLTRANQHSYGPRAATTARRGWVPAHPATYPPVPQRRQRRRPSTLAISAALHGGLPR